MRKSASSSVEPTPECACAKIAAAGSRRRSSIALRASGQPAQRRRLLLDEAAHERPVLVERRPAARRVLLERERQLGPALDRERREAEAAQRLVEVRCPERHALSWRPGAVSYRATGTGDMHRLSRCARRLGRRPSRSSSRHVAADCRVRRESRSTVAGWQARAPVDRAVRVALAARADRRAAARARAAGAAVHLLARLAARVDRRAHQRRRRLERAPPVGLRHVGRAAATARAAHARATRPSTCSRCPATSVWSCSVSPNAPRRVGAAHAREHRVEVGRRGEDVRPEPRERARVQLEHGPVPEHALRARAAQHEPRPADARLAARPHRPSARSSAGASARRRRPRSAARGSSRPPRPTRAAGRRAARRRARPARADAATRPRAARRPAPGGAAPRGGACRPRASATYPRSRPAAHGRSILQPAPVRRPVRTSGRPPRSRSGRRRGPAARALDAEARSSRPRSARARRLSSSCAAARSRASRAAEGRASFRRRGCARNAPRQGHARGRPTAPVRGTRVSRPARRCRRAGGHGRTVAARRRPGRGCRGSDRVRREVTSRPSPPRRSSRAPPAAPRRRSPPRTRRSGSRRSSRRAAARRRRSSRRRSAARSSAASRGRPSSSAPPRWKPACSTAVPAP